MKKILTLITLVVFALHVSAQTNAKREKIKTLLELSGSSKLGLQVGKTMIDAFKKNYTDVRAEFWEEVAKEINADDLIKLVIPIYEKYYSEEDIDQLINFYKSPIGKKMQEVTPLLTQESMAAGQVWGREIAEKVVAKMKELGYK